MEFANNEEQLYLGKVKVVMLAPGKRESMAQSISLEVCLLSVNLYGWQFPHVSQVCSMWQGRQLPVASVTHSFIRAPWDLVGKGSASVGSVNLSLHQSQRLRSGFL